MPTRPPDPISEKVKKERHRHEAAAHESQQRARPRASHALIHGRRDEREGGAAETAEESITG